MASIVAQTKLCPVNLQEKPGNNNGKEAPAWHYPFRCWLKPFALQVIRGWAAAGSVDGREVPPNRCVAGRENNLILPG